MLPSSRLVGDLMQFDRLKRREFVTLLGAAAAWPILAHAQQTALPLIGGLHAASRDGTMHLMAAYREGLKAEGFEEGRNVAIEYRWADGVFDRMPAMMAHLVGLQPRVITAFGSAAFAALAARVAGKAGDIPIVLSTGGDPVSAGFVTNLNRPDNNITGVTSFAVPLAAKRVEFLPSSSRPSERWRTWTIQTGRPPIRNWSVKWSRRRRVPSAGNCRSCTPVPSRSSIPPSRQ